MGMALLEFNGFPAMGLQLIGFTFASAMWMLINNGFLEKRGLGAGTYTR
jgi:hypothetical protein